MRTSIGLSAVTSTNVSRVTHLTTAIDLSPKLFSTMATNPSSEPKLTRERLESHLRGAVDILRVKIDSSGYKH